MQYSLAATQAARRAEDGRFAGLLKAARLVGCRDHGRRGTGCDAFGEVCFFEDHGPLEDHLYLTTCLDAYVCAAREERDKSDCGKAGSHAAESACYGVPGAKARDGADGASGWDGYLRCLPCITRFVFILFNGSFAVLHLLLAGTGKAVDDSGNFYDGAVGEDHRREVHVELSLAPDVPRAFDAIDDSLHEDTGGDQHSVADDDGEGGGEVDAIAGPGALGVDRAAELEENLGSCGDGVGLFRWGRAGGGSG